MSDLTSSREQSTTGTEHGERPAQPLPHTAFVTQWRQTSTLLILRELLDRGDLGHTELRTLELLVRAPHGPVELAKELGVTSAASSGIVDRLEARGHVRREAHATDGRRTQVVLTDSGREEVLGHLIPMFAALAAMDATFDDAERAVIERYLRGATEAIRRVL
jgi:DNA-binding MarR family transcriptional regulator